MCTRIALELAEEGETIVAGQWEREHEQPWKAPEVARAICDTIDACVEETEQTVKGKIVIYTSEGKPWISLPVKQSPPDGPGTYEGTQSAFLQYTQKHLEVMAAQDMKKQDAFNRILLDVVSSLGTLATQREGRTADLEATLMQLREENAQLRAETLTAEQVAEQAVVAAEEAAAAAEAAKKATTDDSKMTEIFMKAVQLPENSTPKKKRTKSDETAH